MNTKKVVYTALFISMGIIISRFFSITTPIVRIGFGFIPTMLSGVLFSPLFAGIVDAAIDLIGATVFPTGAVFLGFTLSAFVSGVIYGLFFYKKNIGYKNIILATVLKTIIVNLGLNTIWLSMLTGKAFMVIIAPRLVKDLIMLPVEIIVFTSILYYLRNSSMVSKINNVVQ